MKITTKNTETTIRYTIDLEDGRIAYYKEVVSNGQVEDDELLIQGEDGLIDEFDDEEEIYDMIIDLISK